MKKLIAVLLTISILASNSTVLANETKNYEDKNSINAEVVCNEDVNTVVSTVITIEDVADKKERSVFFRNENSYKVTVQSNILELESESNARKVVSDSGDKNGKVEASATLQMIWTDVFGTSNKLDKVSGTLTVISGKVESGIVRYGEGTRSALLWTEKNVGASSSFSYEPNMTLFSPAADYAVKFKDNSISLYLKVSSSIFQ